MSSEKIWYAVYTRPKWEKKVSELLSRRKIENFCPLNKMVKQWADRKKVISEPLFTCYVFVHVCEMEHLSVKQTDGVLNFVHWLGKPAQIRHEEIDVLKRFLQQHEEIKLEKIRVNVQDRVKIVSGPLMEREGQVTEVRNKTIKVYLPSLGYAMIAEVKMIDVAIIGTYEADQKIYG